MKPQIIVLLFSFVGLTQAVPFVINSAGSQIDGTAIRSAPDGTVSLITAQGRTLTFRAGTYRRAHTDKPKEMDQVESMVKTGNWNGAVVTLRQIQKQYRFLGWDLRASRMLVRIELAQKNYASAVEEYEKLFAAQPQLKTVPAERANYMKALLGVGRIKETAVLVNEDIVSGSREAAARAQVIRGDMKAAAGQYNEALLDYMRTAILFSEQTVVLPEATYKAAAALKKLNDPRAKKYFQKIILEFPESEFAKRAKGEKQ